MQKTSFSGSVELYLRKSIAFFTPVKYAPVSHVPRVFWAARHTTVCLDNAPTYIWIGNACIVYIVTSWAILFLVQDKFMFTTAGTFHSCYIFIACILSTAVLLTTYTNREAGLGRDTEEHSAAM